MARLLLALESLMWWWMKREVGSARWRWVTSTAAAAAAVMVVAVAEGSFWAVEGADRRPQSRAFTPCRDDNRASFVLVRAPGVRRGFVELSSN